mmetsp:Transcript_53049/g.168333  ORF Transcript_53049/g.168333 Transcript_53049/m.168333 type:complete len:297 (-) Transcript_53049:4311-5201(-)
MGRCTRHSVTTGVGLCSSTVMIFTCPVCTSSKSSSSRDIESSGTTTLALSATMHVGPFLGLRGSMHASGPTPMSGRAVLKVTLTSTLSKSGYPGSLETLSGSMVKPCCASKDLSTWYDTSWMPMLDSRNLRTRCVPLTTCPKSQVYCATTTSGLGALRPRLAGGGAVSASAPPSAAGAAVEASTCCSRPASSSRSSLMSTRRSASISTSAPWGLYSLIAPAPGGGASLAPVAPRPPPVRGALVCVPGRDVLGPLGPPLGGASGMRGPPEVSAVLALSRKAGKSSRGSRGREMAMVG